MPDNKTSSPAPADLLTEYEQEASRQAGLLYSYIKTHIIGHDLTRDADIAELEFHIHGIQKMVLTQAAARAYPGKYRLLGETVKILDQLPPPGVPLAGESANS